MKRFLQISAITFMVMLFAGLRNMAAAQPAGEVSYQDFYDELSPYGRWIDYPEYGYVWCPDEGADFRPYNTNGHWVWNNDYEWMWVSGYSWGWAPFHYGRWFYDDLYGWLWMPGYEWSPAWVTWRSGGDYYGWAPIRPGFSISIGFSGYSPPYNYWCFTPRRYITSPRVYNYCVSPRQNVTIINNTTIVNNYTYNRNVFVTGPARTDAEYYTNSRINSVRVRDISRPGRTGFRHNEVSIYRPAVARENNNRSHSPRRFDQYRGNNVARRIDNEGYRENVFNNRAGRNNNRVEERNNERRDGFNNNRINRGNDDRPANDRRFQQGNSNAIERSNSQRRFDQRESNNRIEWRNHRNEQPAQRNKNDNSVRERSVPEIFGRDNRPGIDRPVQQNRFEKQEPVRNRSNFNRDQWNRNQQPVQQQSNNRREWKREYSNREFSNNIKQRRERSDVFNNRRFNQPQQQRQSFPEMRRQEQPRQFSRPNNNNSHERWDRVKKS